jgi:hypothetical protein
MCPVVRASVARRGAPTGDCHLPARKMERRGHPPLGKTPVPGPSRSRATENAKDFRVGQFYNDCCHLAVISTILQSKPLSGVPRVRPAKPGVETRHCFGNPPESVAPLASPLK